MKVTRFRNYCDGCGDSKAIKETVPKQRTDAVAERPAKRKFMDITGPFPASAGKSRYCLLIVDDNTSMCWPLFMPDKSGSTVCNNVRTWYIENRERIQFHGGWEIGRFDNASGFTSAEFKELLVELGVKAEYTPPRRTQALSGHRVPREGTQLAGDTARGVRLDGGPPEYHGTGSRGG